MIQGIKITLHSLKELMKFHCVSNIALFVIFVSTCLWVSPVYSVEKGPEDQPNILRVGVISIEPFVIKEKDETKGISIELWEEVARINNWKYEYTFLPESGYLDIEPLLKAHKLDLVIGPIAITYNRINDISFSVPYYITTSNVITKNLQSSFSSLLIHFFKRVFRLPLIILLLTVLICSFLIWLKARKNFPDHFPQSFYKGIPYSIWYGFHTICAADIFFEIKDTYSRILTVIMLICSVTLISIAAASITSVLTLSHSGLISNINPIEDFKGQPVAIISGTDVKEYLHNLNANIVEQGSISLAIQALEDDKVVAIIADKLLVRNYLKQNKVGDIHITDIVVRSNIVSFALQKQSELRSQINDSIVHLQNSDWIYRMCLQYLSRREAAFCTL